MSRGMPGWGYTDIRCCLGDVRIPAGSQPDRLPQAIEVKGLVLVLLVPNGWEKGVLRAYRAECVGSMPEVRPRRRIDS